MPELPEVSIIIPARNEETNIAVCLKSLVSQSDVSFEIFVVDDNSEDNTRSVIARFPQVKSLLAPIPPSGWTGKAFAITKATPYAKANWLLFTDADTRHAPGSLRRSLDEAQQNGLVLLSYSPKQDIVTFWERALQPVVFAELTDRFPYEDVSDPASDTAAANGQYMLVRKDAYEKVGGHAAVKGSLLDDVDLARLLKRQGLIAFKYCPDRVETRMYTSFTQISTGWTKNLAALFPDSAKIAVKRGFLGLITLCLLVGGTLLVFQAKNTEAVMSFVIAVGLSTWHVKRVHAAGYPVSDSILSLAGLFLFSYLLFRSNWLYRHGAVSWKGRLYDVQRFTERSH